MTKKVLFGKESRDKMLIGVKGIADAVRVTMGANGKCVMIGEGAYGNDGMVQLPTIVTKDGYTVTKYFQLEDPVENRGAMMIKEAAAKTVEQAGDATTCTCVLAESLISGGMKLIDEGANSQMLKKGMDNALGYVIDELKNMSIPVRGDIERVKQIATVSANNDTSIGQLITDAVKMIGFDGIIDVEEGKGIDSSVKASDGYNFDRGWSDTSALFINDKAKEICEFENPLILLYEKKITHHKQIERAVQISTHQQRPLLIICEDAEGEGLAYLAINTARGNMRCCVVKSPDFGFLRTERMEDIALITGGSYISDIRGIDIESVDLSHFGKAKKVIISKTETVIIGGEKDEDAYDEFIADLKMNLTQAETEDEKYPIEKRIAQLSGSVAVIQIGAAGETELKEKLDRVDDAVRSTRAAIAEGCVAGGGTAFLRIKKPLVDAKFQQGYDIIFNALKSPLKQICENAEVDSDGILQIVTDENGNVGYNVLADEVEDMVKAGIIDATKALRCALTNAVSVAGMILTSECSIITIH